MSSAPATSPVATVQPAEAEQTTSTTTSTTIATSAVSEVAAFSSRVSEIGDELAARMADSWRPGCPVGLGDLRLLELSFWDFENRIQIGELVVHREHAEAMLMVFEELFDVGFQVERMELVDAFAADDDVSMAANNTSAFNCREVAWKPGVWSNHAFGTAIDVNPLVNPYVDGATVLPPQGAAFADRDVRVTGGVYAGDPVVEAFASIGWGWGGDWNGAKDWQHFSASGN